MTDITEDEIDELGFMLEDKGMSHSDIDSYFLEHHGVKGMRWGVRTKDRSRQGRADKLQRYADRRPTRGNIRKAQRAQIRANRPNFWTKRKQRKAAEQAALDARVKDFRESVLKDIGSRSPSELYGIRGNKKNVVNVMTGEEFIQKAKMGMKFTSVQSMGFKINDGR